MAMLALTMPRFRAGEALSEADLGLRSSQSRRVTAEDSNEEALSEADRGLRSSQSRPCYCRADAVKDKR